MEFLNGMDPFLRIFWYIAIPASLIFIIQTIMTFIGIDAHDGADADFSGHLDEGHMPFQLFSLRNLINFLLGFSWTGISFYQVIPSPTILSLVSLVVGIFFVAMYFFIIMQVQKLAENNSFSLSSTINQTAEVYLAIPGNKKGKGKIMISVKGSVREIDAVTEQDSKIESGSIVSVVNTEGDSLVIVKPI